jgi:hypothetical protein
MRHSFLIFYVIFFCNGCGIEHTPCTNYSFSNIYPAYRIKAPRLTPSGIRVDTTEENVSFEMIDRVVDSVERCILDKFPDKLPSFVREPGWCKFEKVRPIARSCLTIKIPSTCLLSKDRTQYMLPRLAPGYLCQEKYGQDYDPKRLCYWRSGIQEDGVVVTCPDLHMLPDPIVRHMTSCYNAWVDELAECAIPRTQSLTGKEISP